MFDASAKTLKSFNPKKYYIRIRVRIRNTYFFNWVIKDRIRIRIFLIGLIIALNTFHVMIELIKIESLIN